MESNISIKELNDKIVELDKRINNLEDKILPDPISISAKEVSINEFLIEKKPTDDFQKCVLIAYYYESYKKYESFNSKDITDGFRLAKEKIPKNISDYLSKCVKKGYFMELGKRDGRKAYQLTNSGIKVVEKGWEYDE